MNFANLFRNEEKLTDYQPGSVVIEQGKPHDHVHVILEGSAEIFVNGKVVEELREGAIFGEMALIDSTPSSATVKAATPLKIASIDERRFLFLVQQHPTFAIELMKVLASRLRHMNAEN